MNKTLLAIALCLAVSITAIAQRSMPQAMQKLLNAEYAISSLYVDSVNEDKLIEDAIKAKNPNATFTEITPDSVSQATESIRLMCRVLHKTENFLC